MASEQRQALISALEAYQSDYAEELVFRDRFLRILGFENCFTRDLLEGHITGSAWIVNDTFTHAFMTHHAKLNKWLQPGGHADGDEHVGRVALKEALEETGMEGLKLYSTDILDLDIHTIPERKGVPEHEHYDIRFMIVTSLKTPFQLSEESNELAWIPFEELEAATGGNKSILRMVEKTRRFAGYLSSGTY